MRLWLAIFFSFQLFNSFSQVGKVYELADLAEANRDSVFSIDLSKSKLTEIPDLTIYPNLLELNLSKNKLTRLPSWFNQLTRLKRLNLSKNKLESFPIYLCALTQLEELDLSENNLGSLPACIGYFVHLKKLDLFETRLSDLPPAFSELRQLEFLDLRGMNFSEPFQTKWRTLFDKTVIEFDQPCDCLEKN
ncbi:MAG: leucine-rich repeat domain-containing protein [Crocinitomicaceae bacterium]|jgi:Leucine-rich repeat (LRR) protein|nr:leucine-rich repeat domain-containing protein [Crocinitomicaceae bacterium]